MTDNPTNNEKELLFQSLKELSSVLSSEEVISIPEGISPLLQACEIVGKASQLKVICPPKPPITIESICCESKIRYRRIVLHPNWWKKDQGDLLGFLKEEGKEGHPVALHFQHKSYVIVDPSTREVTPVNAKTAPLLDVTGYMFYQSLPQEITGIKDIATFCLKGTLGDYSGLMITGTLPVIIGFIFPLANKVFFDYVIPNLNINLYVEMLLAICVGTIGSALFTLCRSFFVLKLSGSIEHRLQMAVWDRLFLLPVHFFRKMGLGDLINRTLVTEQFRRNLSDNTLLILFNGFFSIIYLAMMFFYSWKLSLVGLSIPLVALGISITLSYLKLFYDRALLASNADINTFLNQVMNGICKIRTAAAENRIFSNWAKMYRENQALTLKARNYQLAITTLNKFFNIFAPFLIYTLIIWLIYSESSSSIFKLSPVISVGTFLAFNAAFNPFLQAIMDIGNNLSSLLSFVPFWERARPLFLTPVESSSEKAAPEELTGSCQIQDVSFRYHENSPLILEDISIRIAPKAFIGIVGPSGSGKSTLLQLLIGFETVSKGVISYDHYDINHLNPRRLRQQMGVVSQNSNIFFGSIFDNIVCGGNYTPEQIWEAINMSLLKEELLELPMGLHTILPGGGSTLSGGQRQKLILARALIRKPKIMLLDEATSSLDNQTQHAISENLKTLGMTRIVIAHRFSTILKADHIYVIEKGRITADGSFEELLNKNAWFKHNYERQTM